MGAPLQYRRILRYSRAHRGACAAAIGLNLLAGAVALLQPWPLKALIDGVLGQGRLPAPLEAIAHLASEGSRTPVLIMVVALLSLALAAIGGLIEALASYLSTRLGQSISYDLGRDLFAQLQRRSLQYHASHPVGDSMTRVVTDSWCASGVVNSLVLAPWPAAVTIVILLVLTLRMNCELALISAAAAPLMAGSAVVFGRRVRQVAKARRAAESRIQSHVQQTLSGIHVVQAFGQEERQRGRFTQFADDFIAAQQKNIVLTNLSMTGAGLIATLGTGAVLLAGGHQVLKGHLSVGALLIFVAYIKVLQGQFACLTRAYGSLQGLHGKIERVLELLEAAPEVPEKPGAVDVRFRRGHVQFSDVSFGYIEGRPVLRGISLEARAGERLAIVGASGAGKSTLVSLIPRFHDVWAGSVRIDGNDVRDLRLKSLREQVAIVSQEPFLFPISIAANIAYGRPDASQEQIEAAARAANAHEFICKLPEGYQTVVGERGATLSGGERQRISIARALLKDAPILILDEPTSAVDAQTEGLLVEALDRLMEGRTTLIIAHRLSTIREADWIVVLEDGRTVESGTHSELLAGGGVYARFWSLQFGPQATGVATGG